jgi:hypothetical protein
MKVTHPPAAGAHRRRGQRRASDAIRVAARAVRSRLRRAACRSSAEARDRHRTPSD